MLRSGPLTSLKIVEFAGIGPAPHAAMMLADMGAEIIRIERKGIKVSENEIPLRSRPAISLDLKNEADKALALQLCEKADAVIEGFRPGVMERLGFAPETLHKTNPKLIFARMTGWGQTGVLSKAAGHDLNYIAITGALDAIGEKQKPIIPLNLLGDFGGGSTYLVMGLLAAIIEARLTGKGQVVDVAISDGVANLSAFNWWLMQDKKWKPERESNFLDGGAHFYNIYQCSDDKFISIGSIEPQFYAELRERLNLTDEAFDAQNNPKNWNGLNEKLQALFKTKTQTEWCALLENTDVCFAPVLNWQEAPNYAHNVSRQTFQKIDGVTHPSPAPRFEKTPSKISSKPLPVDHERANTLKAWGITG